jgi:hypothetical protein
MIGTCSTNWEKINAGKMSVGKLERKYQWQNLYADGRMILK